LILLKSGDPRAARFTPVPCLPKDTMQQHNPVARPVRLRTVLAEIAALVCAGSVFVASALELPTTAATPPVPTTAPR